MKNVRHLTVLLGSIAVISACTPTQATRGNLVEDYRLSEVVPGVSTKSNVLQSLGSPTTQAPFDDNVWYYISQKTEKRGFMDPKVVDEKIVVVAFDEDGVVQIAQPIDADRLDVPRVRRKTPTGGNEVTVLQQLLGNVGRFNRPESNAATTAGGP